MSRAVWVLWWVWWVGWPLGCGMRKPLGPMRRLCTGVTSRRFIRVTNDWMRSDKPSPGLGVVGVAGADVAGAGG